MIKLIVKECNSQFSSFQVEGHSTTGKKGNNILCAGVSSLVQAIVLGLRDVLKLDINLVKDDGLINCQIPNTLSTGDIAGVNTLIMTLILAFKDFKNQYPNEIEIQWIDEIDQILK